MSEDSESKQSSQAIEFLKLFQQLGRSFLGLLLLEIGWTLFLVLATKLTGEEQGPPTLGTLPFTQIWVYGAVLIAVFWGVYSRLISYLMAPLLIVFKIIFNIFFVLAAIIFGLLDLSLRPIVRPLRRKLIRRQLRADKAAWIAKNVKSDSKSAHSRLEAENVYEEWLTKRKEEIGADMRIDKGKWIAKYTAEHGSDPENPEFDPEKAFAAWKVEAQREYADRMIESLAAEKVWLQETNLNSLVQFVGRYFLTPLHSNITVGVAPLIRYSQGQELVFERAPLQQFGSAIATVRVKLRALKGLKYIAVHPLPSLFRIETNSRARFARWFFQLDTMVWGRYTQDDEESAQIHFAAAEEITNGEELVGLPYEWRMFPQTLDGKIFSNSSAFIFSPKDPVEMHIVMCLAVLRSLVQRHDKGLPKILVGWDKTYFTSSSDAKRLLAHLAFDIFPLVPDTVVARQVLPTANTALADILSQWAGFQLSDLFGLDEEDKWIREQSDLFAPQLHCIVSKCAKLLPDSADHYYRLGALSCIMRTQERALDEFRHAAVLDRKSERVRSIPAGVLAKMSLDDADRAAGADVEIPLARFAAHAVRAICSGGSGRIRETIRQSTLVEYGRKHPTVTLIQKFLAEAESSGSAQVP